MAKAVIKKPKETGKIQYEHLFKLTVLDKTSNQRETYYAIIRSDRKWGAAQRPTNRELKTAKLYDSNERPLGYVDRKQLSQAMDMPAFAMLRIVKGVYAGSRPLGGRREVKSDAVSDFHTPREEYIPPERKGTVKLGKVKVKRTRAKPRRRKAPPRAKEKVNRIDTPIIIDIRKKPAKPSAPKRKAPESFVFEPVEVARSKESLRKEAEARRRRRKVRKPAPKRKPRRRKAAPKRKPAPSREKRKTALAALRRKAKEAARRRAAARRKAKAATAAALSKIRRSKTRLGNGPSTRDALKGAKVGTTARRSRRMKGSKAGRIVKPSATGKIAKRTTPKPKARPKYAMLGSDMPRERTPVAPAPTRVRLPPGVRGKGTATSPLRMNINLGGDKNIAYDGKIRAGMRMLHFSANVAFSPEKYDIDKVAAAITRQLFRSMKAMRMEKVDFKPVKETIAKELRRANLQMGLWK